MFSFIKTEFIHSSIQAFVCSSKYTIKNKFPLDLFIFVKMTLLALIVIDFHEGGHLLGTRKHMYKKKDKILSINPMSSRTNTY